MLKLKLNQVDIIYSPRNIRSLLQAPVAALRPGKLVYPLLQRRFASTGEWSISQGPSKNISSALAKPLPTQLKRASIPTQIASHQIANPGLRSAYSTKVRMTNEPSIHTLYERRTGTWQYVVSDSSTKVAVIIDPVLDYDPTTQIITTESADSILLLVKEKGLRVERILETHVHADHITAASYLQSRLAQEQDSTPFVCIGKRIVQVQQLLGQRYQIPVEEYERAFDKLLDDDETFGLGQLEVTALHLPGHTPDHMGYMIGDNVFCGDSVLNVDLGTARADFPGGSATDLFKSGRRLLSLSDSVKIWTGHDYLTDHRNEAVPFMSVRDHKIRNKHLRDGLTESEFVALRTQRDATLAAPKLLHPSLQMNILAGRLPKVTTSGQRFLRLPVKLGGMEW